MSSYATIDADVIKLICEAFLKKRQDELMALQEPHIKKSMRPKWFGFVKGKTREEAVRHLEEGARLFGPYFLAKLGNYYDVSVVEKLMKLADIAKGGTVNVDAEAASILWSSFNG